MSASIRARQLCLDVPTFLQPERGANSWAGMFLGASFDPPKRRLARLLDNISFEVAEGDRLAILGRNGAGKSTLLRVLNRVYQPTSGELTVNGSCQALLNMSLGFNAEATVRENIFLRGIAMGLTSSFLRDQVEPILEFSGLQAKATHRLRILSTGQKMRLGFAISTSVQHDIMLMDEWVGAGDSEFMAKAKQRMKGRIGGSKIVVLASHSVGLLRDLCNKGIVIEQGRLVFAGDLLPALKHYHDLMASLRDGGPTLVESPAATAAHNTGQNAGQTVYGCAETIELDQGVVRLRGWVTATDGSQANGLALDVGGIRHHATQIQRSHRADVAQHFGLGQQQCGFIASFAMPQLQALPELGSDVRVLGGASDDEASIPLRIGPDVNLALRGEP